MPLNLEELNNENNGSKSRRKSSQEQPRQQEQLNNLDGSTQQAIASLARAGVNTINAQVFSFDAQLTRYERGTAKSMADRLRQSPLRIKHYLAEELELENVESPDYETFADEFEVPDLTSDFLAIAPSSAMGCLPM